MRFKYRSYGTFSPCERELGVDVKLLIDEYLAGIIKDVYFMVTKNEAKSLEFQIKLSCIIEIQEICNGLDKKTVLKKLMDLFPLEKTKKALYAKVEDVIFDKGVKNITRDFVRDTSVEEIRIIVAEYKSSFQHNVFSPFTKIP